MHYNLTQAPAGYGMTFAASVYFYERQSVMSLTVQSVISTRYNLSDQRNRQ